jgi:acetyl-CoA acetyltransferase
MPCPRQAVAAIKAGKFKNEIVTLTGKDKEGNPMQHSQDQGVRHHPDGS